MKTCQEKTCHGCGHRLPLDSFPGDARYRGGRQHHCRGCVRVWKREHMRRARRRVAEAAFLAETRDRFGSAPVAVARHEQTGRLAAFPVGEPLRPGFAVVCRVHGAVIESTAAAAKI